MPRSRVLSFMSQWGGPRSPTTETSTQSSPNEKRAENTTPYKRPANIDTITPQASAQRLDAFAKASPGSPSVTPSRARGDSRAATRPVSMIQSYQPPQMEVAQDTPAELAPIFSFLNSHSNKLYQEGYFLKLHDLDSRGRPSPDRVWNECFAQLVGTVLSLWDAAALDAAGEDGEVVPTFVNLGDASIKMIESLPMNGSQGGTLQNVLSISTAANNRYLLHFNSLGSLTQWTAGIRLAMFEHSTLQEAYTGSLIAGKGKLLNNIKTIMERSKFVYEDWARVRFGAGTPWKRCWCVISPLHEKDFQKAQKNMKKTSAYERVKLPKGEIKFYDTRKVTKKTRPIATITDTYAAYAIYPQSKPLIDQSTLVKLEGLVTIHTNPESTTEGFVFVMPEVHAAVSGFEMMLRWLFPVYDTFSLYGRPNRLIADTLDQRGLMFAMPSHRRYGYLDILDVSGLIHTQGSQAWSERQWRRELKKLTSTRMMTQADESPRNSRQISQRRNTTSRTSLPPGGGLRFDDVAETHSPDSRSASPVHYPVGDLRYGGPRRTDSAPSVSGAGSPHKRSVSDAVGHRRYMADAPSRLSYEHSRTDGINLAPPPPRHASSTSLGRPGTLDRITSGAETPTLGAIYTDVHNPTTDANLMPLAPVVSPPAFTHSANSRPVNQPYQAPELRRAHSNVDAATLYQMQDASRTDRGSDDEWNGDQRPQQQPQYPGQQLYPTVASNTLANRNLGQPTDTFKGVNDRRSGEYTGRRSGEPAYQTSAPLPGAQADNRTPATTQPQAPPVPLHASRSIARKPIPRKSMERTRSPSPDSPVGTESWEGALIDQDALERILNDRTSTMNSHARSPTPDYASTASIEEVVPKKPVVRTRAGKLKTTGDPDYVPKRRYSGAGTLDTWQGDQLAEQAEIPNVNFGPTYAYKPTMRPSTSGTMATGLVGSRRGLSSGNLVGSQENTPQGSPAESRRHSYFGVESPSNRNSVAWQPAQSPGLAHTRSQSQTLTPEQWVAHRAALAAQPQMAPPRKSASPLPFQHQRQSSMTSPIRRVLTKTPPLSRTHSGDWTQQVAAQRSRTPSGDWTQHAQQAGQQTPPSRPQSRGAGTMLNSQSPGGLLHSAQPTNLTAREQMHVARSTGTPLISVTTNTQRKAAEPSQPGLFGALAAREKEKEDAKKELNRRSVMGANPMVQQAIAIRQQQQAQQEAQAQAQWQIQQQQQAAQQAQALHAQQMEQVQWQQQQLTQSPVQSPGSQYGVHGGFANLAAQEAWEAQLQRPGSQMSQQQSGSNVWQQQQRKA